LLHTNETAFSVWSTHPDGSSPQRLHSGRMPDWGPAGDRLVAISTRDSAGATVSSIVVFSPTDSAQAAVRTFFTPFVSTPRYSPDGASIAFSMKSSDGLFNIWLISASGGDLRQVTTQGGTYPTWSPDGIAIAYVRTNWALADSGAGTIWTHDLHTDIETQITSRWPVHASLPLGGDSRWSGPRSSGQESR
jgi:Tol biopolymer transport system component